MLYSLILIATESIGREVTHTVLKTSASESTTSYCNRMIPPTCQLRFHFPLPTQWFPSGMDSMTSMRSIVLCPLHITHKYRPEGNLLPQQLDMTPNLRAQCLLSRFTKSRTGLKKLVDPNTSSFCTNLRYKSRNAGQQSHWISFKYQIVLR